jgi:transcriptional regulator with XRE-family HTH domain
MEMYKRRLARRVKYFRVVRGVTQERLAAEAGIHPSYVALIEREEANPSLRVVVAIAEALETTPAILLSLSEPEGSPGATSQM